jgi:hypothetical protein
MNKKFRTGDLVLINNSRLFTLARVTEFYSDSDNCFTGTLKGEAIFIEKRHIHLIERGYFKPQPNEHD